LLNIREARSALNRKRAREALFGLLCQSQNKNKLKQIKNESAFY